MNNNSEKLIFIGKYCKHFIEDKDLIISGLDEIAEWLRIKIVMYNKLKKKECYYITRELWDKVDPLLGTVTDYEDMDFIYDLCNIYNLNSDFMNNY